MPLERLALARSTLDRAGELRSDPALIGRLAADQDTRVLAVRDGRALTVDGPAGLHLLLLPPSRWPALAAGTAVFLGLDADRRAHLAYAVAEPEEGNGIGPPAGAVWSGLRDVGVILDDTDAGLLTTSVAVLGWHAAHPHCARCGHPTQLALAGWERRCPNCGATHYPRTDPAVIMTIVDADGRVLLGRQAVWPALRFSTLAGFVEPGESLEDAVRREVAEESGVVVGAVTYLGSQPWPFPSSLMLGFRGRADTTDITVDGAELTEAHWWSRAQLRDDVRAGRLLLPPAVSIARRLIEEWFGGPIEGATQAWR